MSGYAQTARAYHAAGWFPLPLPHAKKWPPPDDTTGTEGRFVSAADVETWCETQPDANVALRLPKNVVGIDLDAYKPEAGQTYARLCSLLGPLPDTWRSTSRADGTSGIYFFQLPDARDWVFGDVGPGIETLRWNHRYAVVSPSLSPPPPKGSGDYYRWYRGAQEASVPRPSDLPMLPDSWISHLESQVSDRKRQDVDDVPTVAYDALPESDKRRVDRYLASTIDGIVRDLRESATMKVGDTDGIGRGWEKIQADKAIRLAALALADWNTLTVEQAWEHFSGAAPTGGGWGPGDVQAKWNSQLRRAEPAAMPNMPATTADMLAAMTGIVPSAAPAPSADGTPAAPPAASAGWRKFTWDDFGNAERIVAMHGGRLRWMPDTGKWAIFLDGRWVEYEDGGERAAMDVIARLRDLEMPLYDATPQPKPKGPPMSQQDDFAAWIASQRYAAKAAAAARSVRHAGLLNAPSTSFDANPMLLNAGNGVVDLMSGALMPAAPELLMMQQTHVHYDPSAGAPRWEAFIERVMPNPMMRDYLQRIVGYTLTGSTEETVFFIHHGETNNGKSVFIKVLRAMFGEYGQIVPSATILTKKTEQHPTDLNRMAGKRALLVDETPKGAALDEARVKQISSGGQMTARGMGKDFREFEIVGKLHIATNHIPHINHDPATIRRIRPLLWPVRIPDSEVDRTLPDKIIGSELPGVLAWAVRGAQMWRTHGLGAPVEAVMDVEQLVESEDEFGLWLSERTAPSVNMTTNERLYGSYKAWAEAAGVRSPKTRLTWAREMAARGFESARGTGGVRGWLLAVRDPSTAPFQM